MDIPIPIIAVIIGSIFSILGLVIGAMMNVLNKNTEAFKKIEVALAKQETADGYEEKACTDRHGYIKEKLKEHSMKIEAHGMIIQEHEQKIKAMQGI